MGERSHDVPKGASHRGTWFEHTIPVTYAVGDMTRITATLWVNYSERRYSCTHDGIAGFGDTLNQSALAWIRQKIARDIERT